MNTEYMTKHGVTYQQFVHGLVKSPAQLADEMNFEKLNLNHMIFGICGEAGELLENAKYLNSEKNLVGELGNYEFYFLEELGDYEFYFVELVRALAVIIVDDIEYSFDTVGELFIELAIESANMLDCVKKYTVYNKTIDSTIAIRHASNIRFLLDMIYDRCEISKEKVLEYNVDKLSIRYENLKFSNEAASERKDKA